ncbi:Carbohydrate-binding module family 13 protein [Mycena venus]|uniref:Carbohydrate-binding module family 13 protein n=1 Tax=Mycena venus TaxID=2733690 RepID=A0A8H6X5Z7_9AGAR|nr:Carbohydrate-binding module family 13 protein [Mycena venus]
MVRTFHNTGAMAIYKLRTHPVKRNFCLVAAMPLAQGIYSITIYDSVSWAMEIAGGSPSDHTQVQIWQKASFGTKDSLNQLWMVKTTTNGNYTLRNLRSGSYMDMAEGSAANGTHIIGFQSNGSNNQQWKIIEAGEYYKIRNVQSQTYANLAGNYHANGNHIIGYKDTGGENNELWKFERRDVSAAEIQLSATKSGYDLDINLTSRNPMFYVPPAALLSEIWHQVSLNSSSDKGLAFQQAVSTWAEGNIRAAQDFSLLVGYARGTEQAENAEFNWTLSDNYSSVVFFSPTTGSTIAYPGGHSWGFF